VDPVDFREFTFFLKAINNLLIDDMVIDVLMMCFDQFFDFGCFDVF
jgi:hypothetical protein